jgi:hypothetical protein
MQESKQKVILLAVQNGDLHQNQFIFFAAWREINIKSP